MFCFFKQKTAYEMRISDWSSDVCSSDLMLLGGQHLCDAKTGQPLGRILDIFDFVADAIERGDDIGDRETAIQMLFQPVESDLHAEIPPLSVGCDSAPNP